jgi:predicted enzyme related to lactoylglutathione lyase
MSERSSYAPGTPSWIDLGTPSFEGAQAFYGGLFGWTITKDPRPEAGGYGMATLRGKNVAGIGPQMNTDMPPFWSVYVTVTDAAASLEKAADLGGTIVMDAMDVLEVGVMGIIQDPTGSFISVWQPKQHIGAELVNEPGAFTWNELATRDLTLASEFYTELFGWRVAPESSSESGTIFTLDGAIICGAHTAGEGEFPAWSVWFWVDDCDASAAMVKELGGQVYMPPTDMSFGRGAVVADPTGAVFGIGAMGAGS